MAENQEQSPELKQIDQILQQEDPEFSESVKSIKVEATDVVIETLVKVDDDNLDSANPDVRSESKPKLFTRLVRRLEPLQTRLRLAWINFKMFIRTQPKELFFYTYQQVKVLGGIFKRVVIAFLSLSRLQKIGLLVVIGMLSLAGWIARHNLQGDWLPSYGEEFLSNYDAVADQAWTIEPQHMPLLREALPQPEFQVLLEKIVINFKRRSGFNENPMGTYEIIVGVDNQDTAVEIRARKKEFIDVVSRGLEDYTYPEVAGPLGIERIKKSVQESLNRTLTQGYVLNVYLKIAITKP